MNLLTNGIPNPVLGSPSVPGRQIFVPGRNKPSTNAGLMPIPSSRTSRRTIPRDSSQADNSTTPPRGENLAALVSKLESTLLVREMG